MSDCEKWLLEFLKGKDIVLCDTVREEAKKQGFKRKQLKEARSKLKVETINNWAWNEGQTSEWFWRLPE